MSGSGFAVGASLLLMTSMRNEAGAALSTPPLAMPPSSDILRSIVAEPNLSAAGVNIRVPSGAMDGPAARRPGFEFPTTENETA